MNQVLKDRVYHYGTQKQIDFIATIGGMTEEETKVFKMIHDGKSDLYIQEEIGVSRKTYNRIEESIRAKLMLAIFDCINHRMDDGV